MKYYYTIGIVSGHWNPLHFGHIEYIQGAKELCDFLVCIVNNDNQVKLKGSKKFMDEQHRMKMLDNIKGVDSVFLSIDTDKSVCKSIEALWKSVPNVMWKFFNSGDRKPGNIDSSEQILCKKLGIEYIFIDKPKIYSSSQLLSQ